MCGRYSRSRYAVDYVEPLMTDTGRYDPADFRPSWNIAPGTRQPVIRPYGAQLEHWGYRPAWAVARGVPQMINARLDKAGSSAWKSLWTKGRAIVPADGWYEWAMEAGKKQPYYIRAVDGAPLYFAGLTSVKLSEEAREGDGYVIVTAAADGGLVDVHDRRPVALTADDARAWLSPETSLEEATHIANNLALPATAFECYPVSRAVGKVGNDEPSLNDPI